MTRERVRQIQEKSFKKISEIVSDNIYKIDNEIKQIFEVKRNAFQINNSNSNYAVLIEKIFERNTNLCFKFDFNLGLILDKNTSLEDLLDDEDIDIAIKEIVEKFIYKNYILIDGRKVKDDKATILNYFVKFYCKNSTKFGDFQNLYMDFLINNNLNDRTDLLYNDNTLYNKLSNNKTVLLSAGKFIRYYNSENIQNLIKILNLTQYKNIEISSKKIFNDNIDLMEEYDIRNEYELHNLLKKNIKDSNIDFARMPTIRFGNTNKEEQVLNLLKQLSPIKYMDLAKAYEDEYGVDTKTFCANYLNFINKYLVNGYYVIETEELHSEYLQKLKCLLNKDFYWKDELENISRTLLNGKSIQNLNARNLKVLNFSVTSKCIYSDEYDSLADYIKTYLTNNDIIDLNRDNRLRSVQFFYQVFSEMKNNLELIEFTPSVYINIKKLNSIGITKNDLIDYQNKVKNFIYDKYFTISSLKNAGFSYEELDDLGFEDYFYANILLNNPHMQSRKINNEYLLQYSTKPFELSDFITYLMGSLREIDICDFCNYIESKYGLKINRYQIASATKECELYYNRIMEKVYIDYEEYYNGF